MVALGYPQHAGEEVVILQGQRGPMTPRGVQSFLAKYGTLAGLDDLSPHALRHTFCKNLIDADVGLEQVAALEPGDHETLLHAVTPRPGAGRRADRRGRVGPPRLSADGRVEPAETAFRRGAEILEPLHRIVPEHVETALCLAQARSGLRQWDEAERLVDAVLVRVPRHPFANQLKRYIVAMRGGGSVANRLRTTGEPGHDPWWKRWLRGKGR